MIITNGAFPLFLAFHERLLFGFSLLFCYRYGIRVDPWQWFLFLSGTYEGGEEHPSILLIICKFFDV